MDTINAIYKGISFVLIVIFIHSLYLTLKQIQILDTLKDMDIRIKRFDKTLPIPEYKTAGAAAFDLYSREDVTLQPNEMVLIPLNIAIQLPKGYFLLLANRSSTYKLGITCINGIGVGDSDYCGDNDEYMFPAINYTKEVVHIEKGTRVCQALILPVSQVNILDVGKLDNKDRGGFGSTGRK